MPRISSLVVWVLLSSALCVNAAPRAAVKNRAASFRVLAFYTGKNDPAHVSFVREANSWFARMAVKYHFAYDATDDWSRLTTKVLARYQVVLFLDTRPESTSQRAAFQRYMDNGGAWMGFHFSAFALAQSSYPTDWDWYHDRFLGSGEYKGNTWRPTSAVLRVEARTHPSMKHMPAAFISAPNEWYSWKKDLRTNPDIRILVSIDSTSFPLGTGPKPYEIWHDGYYPVVWTNTKYRMMYINMGHNDIDYEHHTNAELSFTFTNDIQNIMIIDGLLWLGRGGSMSASHMK